MSAKKNILILIVSTVFCFIFFEILSGYYMFGKTVLRQGEYPVTWHLIKQKIIKPYIKRKEDKAMYSTSNANPFLTYDNSPGYKLHPFIDYSGVHSKAYEKDIILDYFGFRNKEDLYFKKGDYILIVITGGSEAAGYSHKNPISEILEDILNKEGVRKFRVLNLAMNSYVISNEINVYVQLAYHLHPEFVISHTGWNDMLFAWHVPSNFKRLGLNYMDRMETWLPRLYDLKDKETRYKMNLEGGGLIVDQFIENLAKYRQIVTSNNGSLIVGIQSHNSDIDNIGPMRKPLYLKAHALYKELESKVPEWVDVKFSSIKNINFVDTVHTDDPSANLIARIYADLILKKLKNYNSASSGSAREYPE